MRENDYLNDNSLSKWVKEDIEAIYKAQKEYLNDESNDMKYYLLKKAIWNLSITIKSEVVTGEINPVKAEEIKDFFWRFLL